MAVMMLQTVPTYARMRTIVNSFRVAILATVAFLALLMAAVAVTVAIWDISDRAMTIVSVVLTALPTMVTGLLVYLKVDSVDVKADIAARRATTAAHRATTVASKVEAVHEFVANGGLRTNVRQALSEERHMLRNRETVERAKSQIEELTRRRQADIDAETSDS